VDGLQRQVFNGQQNILSHPLTIADSKQRGFLRFIGQKDITKRNFSVRQKEFIKRFLEVRVSTRKQVHTEQRGNSPVREICSLAIQRYTRLSYWFIELGIDPVYPDQCARHAGRRMERHELANR